MKTAPQEVTSIHEEAQKKAKDAGVKEVTEVWSQIMIKAQADAMSQNSKMPRNSFQSIEDG